MRTPARLNPYNPNPAPAAKLKCAIFKVDCLLRIGGHHYALYTASNGKRKWTKDYGYEPNDEVWLYYYEGAREPHQIIVNGKEIEIKI